MSHPIVFKQMAIKREEPDYFIDQYLLQGTYALIITVPFDTRLAVSIINPAPGFQFFPDADPNPFIWNSRLIVPVNGQFRFLVRLDRPIMEGEMQVQFILVQATPPPQPPPPTTPPWPPVGSAQQIWDNPYYQAIIRRLHPLWVAEGNQRLQATHGPGWYMDPWGRAIHPPNMIAVGPPDGIGGSDAAMWCWFNLSNFNSWIVSHGP